MAQNIYDDAEFFAGYSRLSRSVEGLAGAAEWPTLRAMAADLRGRRVLDLGCGYGWFCRWARENGAAQVLGVDLSERMLARAATMTADPAIAYVRADLDRVELPAAAFDFAYSSLVLHYVDDLPALLAKVHRALVPDSRFVFSVEHPIFSAPAHPGWLAGADGRKTWPVDSYLVEGPRTTDWITTGVVKQHRTIATYLNLLIRLGFTLEQIEEWGPTDAQIAADPSLGDERQRPNSLLVAARR